MADNKSREILFEDCDILFRNFSGAEGRFNAAGDRNFCLKLPHDVAEQMESDGWNIKYLKPRDEDELPQPYTQVTVKFKEGQRPPKIVMITSNGKTTISEDMAMILDWADIKQTDLIINAYNWEVNGKRGIKAYLKSIYVTINEDELDKKYIDVPDSASNSVGILEGQSPLALESMPVLEEAEWGE